MRKTDRHAPYIAKHMPTQSTVTDRRSTPRYPVDTRVFASIADQAVILNNISLSGVAMRARGLAVGSVHLLEINLKRQHVALAVEILDTSDEQLLHARFVEPSRQAQRIILEYISDFR